MTKRRNIEQQECEKLMDYLMDGEETLQQASSELKISKQYLAQIATYLQAQGLVDSRKATVGGRREIRWFMRRTRRSA